MPAATNQDPGSLKRDEEGNQPRANETPKESTVGCPVHSHENKRALLAEKRNRRKRAVAYSRCSGGRGAPLNQNGLCVFTFQGIGEGREKLLGLEGLLYSGRQGGSGGGVCPFLEG